MLPNLLVVDGKDKDGNDVPEEDSNDGKEAEGANDGSNNSSVQEVSSVEEPKGAVPELNSPRNLAEEGNDDVIEEGGQVLLPEFPQQNSPEGVGDEFEGLMQGKRELWQTKNEEEPFNDYALPPDDISDKSDRMLSIL